jgi:outer membrane protein assembly factor BamB
MMGSPSVAAGMVFASSNVRTYYGINATTGEIVWAFTDPAAMEFIVSSPIYVNGELFIIDKFSITSLNATNGNTNWSFFTGDELYASPSYADGKLYTVTSQRHLFILDALNNGTKMATATTPSSSWSSPTISNGRLYVGNHDWNVYCYTNNITHEASLPPVTTNDQAVYIYAAVIITIAVLALTAGYILKRSLRS